MFSIGPCDIQEELHLGKKSVIYRARYTETGQPVIIKALQAEYPSTADVLRCKREYEVARAADCAGVVRPLELLVHNNGYALVLEDFGGLSLQRLLQGTRLDLRQFLQIAACLAGTLGDLHQKNIIHKDIKPGNIIVNLEQGVVKLTDFGIASLLSSERQEMLNPQQLEGTLPYMSPEQTGRMNRLVDSRTDIYSLGVTFYEMLTGRVPFVTNDPVELIHCHIAKQPTPPDQVQLGLPPVVSDIVMRCLAKNAEDRYQSAYGLQSDLEACLVLFEQGGVIDRFEIGTRDHSDWFRIPEKLYGRDEAAEALHHAFNTVCTGHSAMLLVAGYSGMGKSHLVQELHQPVTQEKGLFLTGKFQQFKRHIPYDALLQAFKQLVYQLLTENEANIGRWREQILQAVGSNGQVLIDVLPELELVIGKQASVQKLPPAETQVRFQRTMQHFIGVFATAEHPLVLFLDDLQWADPASLYLIQYLLSDANTPYFLFVGAYRHKEVSATDPLMLLRDELQHKSLQIYEIQLKPLDFASVNDLIADTLQCTNEEAAPLTEIVRKKTNGNPFFVKQFLTALHAQGLVYFDHKLGRWMWQIDAIREMEITDNVVEFMLSKIKRLPPRTQEALQIAACIGSTFDMRTLAHTLGQSQRDVAADLWEALQEGFLLPVGTAYKLLYSDEPSVGNAEETANVDVSFKFLHDRVQQVAYSLLEEGVRQKIHLIIGRWLQQQGRRDAQSADDRLFEIVNHLNEASQLLQTLSENEQLARLNLEAGRRAKASTAYDPAQKYLIQGVQMLASDAWQSQYELAFALYRELSEIEYLCGRHETAESYFNMLLLYARTALDKASVCHIKSILYANQGRFQDSIHVGVEGLRLLGFRVPAKSNKVSLLLELVKAKRSLHKKDIEDLVNLPKVTDRAIREAMELLLHVSVVAYFLQPDLFVLLNLKALNFTLQYGNSVISASAYGTYGIVLNVTLGDPNGGYKFGQLAVTVDDLYHEGSGTQPYKGIYGFAEFVQPWKEPLRHLFDNFKLTYQRALESGDLLFANYSVQNMFHVLFLCGHSLEELMREGDKYLDFVKRTRVEGVIDAHMQSRGLVLALRGESAGLLSLSHEDFDEEQYLATHQHNEESKFSRFWYGVSKIQLLYHMEAFSEARQIGRETDQLVSAALGQLHVTEHYLYYALAMAANWREASTQEQNGDLKLLYKILRKFKKWAKHAPMNFEPSYLLIRAEVASLIGNDQEARELYDQAIDSALAQGFVQIAAIGNECAARYYLRRGKEKIAKVYWMEARYGYIHWGAHAKVKEMERRHPHLLAQKYEADERFPSTSTTTAASLHSTETSAQSLDLLTVMKAARAISGEIVLENLLASMIDIVVENAGGDRGVLLIARDGRLWVEAEKDVKQGHVRVLQAVPFDDYNDMASMIVQYVRRMREDVVLHDAPRSEMFAKDAYIQDAQPRSILCMPIVNQGRLVGILYVENRLTKHAFTADRLEVMQLLSSQIAVSIENAELYDQQVQLNAAYGKFVPHQFLRFLNKDSILDVRLGDHVQTEMTVLFSDMRSFTTLSERMTPEETFTFLNSYLNQMEPLIIENRGFIDKFIGDSIMSLFDQSADDAVRAGIALLQRLAVYNTQRTAKGDEPLQIGIGINSGRLMLGTLGGHNRMDSTVISDAVNLASRIEGLTKVYGVPLLISEHTYRRLQDPASYHIRVVDRVKVKGKQKPVLLYEVFDADEPEVRDGKVQSQPEFEAAYALYQEGRFEEAHALFAKCLAMCQEDRTAKMFAQRCQERLTQRTTGDSAKEPDTMLLAASGEDKL